MKKKIILFIIGISLIGNSFVFADDKKEKNITISIMGDVLLDRSIGKCIEKYGSHYPWQNISTILQKSDLAIINLETSVGVGGKPIKNKSYTFQSKPETLEGLVKAGIDGVAIANNHILDFGKEGFIETLENLEKMGIQYAGGGRNLIDAKKPALWHINGVKIGLLAFSRVIPDINWYATDKRPGILSAYNYYIDKVSELVNETKKDVDFLIVSLHWGKELKEYPEEKDIHIAKKLIDSGADCIMGHHPHVLQGVEFYKNKPIVYSLGNFVFNAKAKKSNQTMIFHIKMNKEGILNTNITPILIKMGQPTLAEGKEREEIINILNRLSQKWDTKFLPNGNIQGNVQYVSSKREKEIKKIKKIDNKNNTKKNKKRLAGFFRFIFISMPLKVFHKVFK